MKKYLITLLLVFGMLKLSAEVQTPFKYSGLAYFDYFYNTSRDNLTRDTTKSHFQNSALNGQKDLYGFQFRRIYFTMDYDVSEKITTRFRLETDQAALSSNGKISTFIKDAYLKYKDVFIGSDLILGIQPTIGLEIADNAWGFRSLEKTQLDLRGQLASRDMGVTLKGKITYNGLINYAIQYGNSSNLSPEIDAYKRISGLLQCKPINNLQFTVYYEENFASKDRNLKNLSLFANYSEQDKFNIGAEIFLISQAKSYIKFNDTLDLKKLGFSFYGNYYFLPNLGIVLRYDMYDPNNNSDSKGDSRNYIVAGFDWKVDKKFSVIPNIQFESYEKVNVNNVETKFKPSMNARITFVYVL